MRKKELIKKQYRELKEAIEERRRKEAILADSGVGNTAEVHYNFTYSDLEVA